MTNRLELNWKLDGFVDEQRYYCSTSPINLNSLPIAKAVLAGDMRSYIDSDIQSNTKYYIRISSIKNGVEKPSNQVEITPTITYINKFNSSSNIQFLTASIAPNISVDEVNGGLTVSASAIQNINIKLLDSPPLKNFIAEFDVTFVSVSSNNASVMFVYRTTNWGVNAGNLAYMFGRSVGGVYLIKGNNGAGTTETDIINVSAAVIPIGQKIHFKIETNDSTHRIYQDGVLLGEATEATFSESGQFGFRSYTTGPLTFKIENLTIVEN